MLALYAMQATDGTSLSEHLQPVHYVDLAQNYLLDANVSAARAAPVTDLLPAISEAPGNTPKADEILSSANSQARSSVSMR